MFRIYLTTKNPAVAEQIRRWDEQGVITLERFDNPEEDFSSIIGSLTTMEKRHVRALCGEGLPIHAIKKIREEKECSLLVAKNVVDYLKKNNFLLDDRKVVFDMTERGSGSDF